MLCRFHSKTIVFKTIVLIPKWSFSFQNYRLYFKTIVLPFLKTNVLKTIVFCYVRFENNRFVFLLENYYYLISSLSKMKVFKSNRFQIFYLSLTKSKERFSKNSKLPILTSWMIIKLFKGNFVDSPLYLKKNYVYMSL